MFKSVLGKKYQNIIFLHGWATTWESLFPIIFRLKSKYNIYAPNLPYPTVKVLTLDDYCEFVLNYMHSEKISNPVIIGHSLGGAIATKIAAYHSKEIKALVLKSAASIRHPLPEPWLTLQKTIGPISPFLRPLRNLALRISGLDATDYLNLKSQVEKDTFRNLIADDHSQILPQITCPTLILWGNEDTSTPMADGLKIHSLIKNSKFKSFPNTGHFFYLDYPNEVVTVIDEFIQNET